MQKDKSKKKCFKFSIDFFHKFSMCPKGWFSKIGSQLVFIYLVSVMDFVIQIPYTYLTVRTINSWSLISFESTYLYDNKLCSNNHLHL